MDGTVQICRGFAVAQWKTLHSRLINRDGTNSDDQEAWHCAIEVFERRIRERFLSSIEALEAADSRLDISAPDEAPSDCSSLPKGKEAVVPGFAIMALCCLLAETLQSFRCRTEMPHRPEARCSYPNGPCIKALNRSTFYRALKDDFAEYLAELRNPKSVELRSRFRKKMNDMAKEA